jgi:hypothetical protein
MLTVTVPASTKLLTQLSTLKRELSLEDDDSNDPYLSDLIDQATAFIESYTERVWARETVIETKGSLHPRAPWMVLERTPILSITQVALSGSTVSSTTYTIEDPDAGLVFREDGWTVTQIYDFAITRTPTNWTRKEWSFTYVGGYVTPCMGSSEGVRTLPFDVERACIDLCKWRFNQKGDFNPAVKRQRTADASEEYFGSMDDGGTFMPPSVKTILDRYRKMYVSQNG